MTPVLCHLCTCVLIWSWSTFLLQEQVTMPFGAAAWKCYGFADLHSGVFSKLQVSQS